MKIFVFGSTGMLGNYVATYFERQEFNVVRIKREDINISNTNIVTLSNWFAFNEVGRRDVAINCAGLIRQKMTDKDTLKAIKTNSVFPWILNDLCRNLNINLIHISTDCCFSGNKGQYTERDIPDADDMYGLTKAAGEPTNCAVIRTSMIGEAKDQKSLLEWVRSQCGNPINGFKNHLWNGITCLQLAKVLEHIVKNQLWWTGVRHLYTTPVTKAELVRHIATTYFNDMVVNDIDAIQSKDMTLKTLYPHQLNGFVMPDILTQIKEQKEFGL